MNYLKNHNILNIKSCFDIGSDVGYFVDELNRMGIDTEGIEKDTHKIQSKRVRGGTFDLDYVTDKKYDLITLPQVIYFLGNFEDVLRKLKNMLNHDGRIFIVSIPKEFFDKGNPITFSDAKTYPLHTRKEYEEIFQRLGFEIMDYSVCHNKLAMAFNNGKINAMLRIILFMTGLRKTIIEDSDGNNLFMLLKTSNTP